MKKIDRVVNKEDMVPKAVKQTKKTLETNSNPKQEGDLLKRIKFLEESVQYIQQRDKLDERLREINA